MENENNYTKIQIECNNDGYGITTCPHLHKDIVFVGGYFCGYLCKYYKGRNRREKQVYCSFLQRPTPDHWLVKPYDAKVRFDDWEQDVE